MGLQKWQVEGQIFTPKKASEKTSSYTQLRNMPSNITNTCFDNTKHVHNQLLGQI